MENEVKTNNEQVEVEETEKNEVKNNYGVKAENEIKSFAKEEVNKRVQSETDKVRTEYTKKIKVLEEELNGLKPTEKTEGELALEARLKALEDKEKAVQAKEQLLNINNKLNEQGLPSELAKYLQGAENVETEIEDLKEIFNNYNKSSLQPHVPTKHKGNNNSITKEKFKSMSREEKFKLFNEDKELYNQLNKQ